MGAGAWWRWRGRRASGSPASWRAALELAGEREMYTIAVRATELERSYPYGLVRQSADSVALTGRPRSARRCLPARPGSRCRSWNPAAQRTRDSPELMYQRLHGLYWLTANLARERPAPGLPIDDAQWADEASMAAQRFLSLRIADLPMVLLLAVRTTDVGPLAVPLAEILADPATVSIRPGPLSPDGARQRVEALLGSADPDFAAAMPSRHRRQPVPARAARERGPRGGH